MRAPRIEDRDQSTWRGRLALLGLCVVGSACVELDPSAAATCQVGARDCTCTAGGGCDPGLECRDQVCAPIEAATTSGPGPGSSTGSADESTGSTGSSTGSTDESTGSGDVGPDPAEVEEVCNRWLSDRADLSEGTWSGDAAACDAGTLSEEGRNNALRLFNLYRWLADLPPVTLDPAKTTGAQLCALLLHANGTTSNEVMPDWACYTREGAEAVMTSRRSDQPSVAAVDLHLSDVGRHFMIADTIETIGIGSTTLYSCELTVGPDPVSPTREWIAWPPPGPFPHQAVAPSGVDSLQDYGWSLQSSIIDLYDASVMVTSEGEVLPVTVEVNAPGLGSIYGIRFIPDGWSIAPDTSYHVRVDGVMGGPIEYDVHVVTCR